MADFDAGSHDAIRAGITDRLLISPLCQSLAPECVELLFQAYMTNPLNTALFGSGDAGLRRKRRATQLAWRLMLGETSVATIDGRVVGVLHFIRHPQRAYSRWQIVREFPRAAWMIGPVAARAIRWRKAWCRVHPRQEHSHLGPVAVLPEFQGRGIGTEMLKWYCSMLDRITEASYLETDRQENVRLYRRFGFEVTTELTILGVPNWFMWREARSVE